MEKNMSKMFNLQPHFSLYKVGLKGVLTLTAWTCLHNKNRKK